MLDKGLRRDQKARCEHDDDALCPVNDIFEVLPPVPQSPGSLRHHCHFSETSGNPGRTLSCAAILDVMCNEVIPLHTNSFLRPIAGNHDVSFATLSTSQPVRFLH